MNSVTPFINPLVRLNVVLWPQVSTAAKSPCSEGPGTESPQCTDITCSSETRREETTEVSPGRQLDSLLRAIVSIMFLCLFHA